MTPVRAGHTLRALPSGGDRWSPGRSCDPFATASATGLPVSRRRWEGLRDERARIALDPRRDGVGALVGVRPTPRAGRARATVPRGAGPGSARFGLRGRALAARAVAAARFGACRRRPAAASAVGALPPGRPCVRAGGAGAGHLRRWAGAARRPYPPAPAGLRPAPGGQ